ncbi:MAG: diacylglycerol kinase family lipid kinase [Clostridia bacterium]|nr:diacylglycerol kinase family lipid kinase [Clostridia bacterium]
MKSETDAYAFILNPIAGSGFAVETMEKIEAEMKRRNQPYRVFRTEAPGHGTELARRLAADETVRAVISVGGDGTAFEVASGVMGTGKPMAVIPAGTGNDFIKTAKIPKDPMEALNAALTGTAAPVDMGRLGEGSFLNVCGTGFDVTVLDFAESLKQRYRGLLPYFLGLLKAIAHYRPVRLKLEIDGQKEEGEYLICSVANGRYIGGGIPICPAADPEDGKLDVVLVKNVPRRKIPLYLPGLMMGRILHFRVTRHLLAEEVHMEGENMRLNVDGEIFSMNRADFAVRKKVLNLIR